MEVLLGSHSQRGIDKKNVMVLEDFQGWHFCTEIQKLILLEISCVQESLVKDGEAWNVVELEPRLLTFG
jgi:hypothetical protein